MIEVLTKYIDTIRKMESSQKQDPFFNVYFYESEKNLILFDIATKMDLHHNIKNSYTRLKIILSNLDVACGYNTQISSEVFATTLERLLLSDEGILFIDGKIDRLNTLYGTITNIGIETVYTTDQSKQGFKLNSHNINKYKIDSMTNRSKNYFNLPITIGGANILCESSSEETGIISYYLVYPDGKVILVFQEQIFLGGSYTFQINIEIDESGNPVEIQPWT